MPAPEKTSLNSIVAAGKDILEAGGQDGLTMQSVARRVGVRAPSLYKHVRDRAGLLAAVTEATVEDLITRLEATDGSLEELARGHRAFARDRPHAFRLMLTSHASPGTLQRAAGPLLRASAELAGERDALEAARLVTAWITGFIEMELGGTFRLGGEIDRAFDYGLRQMRRALTESGAEAESGAKPEAESEAESESGAQPEPEAEAD